MIGQPITRIIPYDRLAEEAAILDRLRRGERLEHFETVRLAKAGRRLDLSLTISPIRDAAGTIIGASKIARDITERKRAEAALRESEGRWRTLIEAIPQLVWTARADGHCDYLSQRWMDYTGTTLGQNLGSGWAGVVHPDEVSRVRQTWAEAVATGTPYQVECRLRSAQGDYRWQLVRAVPLRDDQGQVVRWFGACTDITELVEARQTLARSREELERLVAQRTARLLDTVAELEAFSYSLSHDLRAPLRAIQSFTELVLANCADTLGPPNTDFLKQVIGSAERMDRLIQDVLAFSRLSRQEIQLGPVDVERLVRDIIQERPAWQPPRAEITIESPLLPMRGHGALLTQCLTNLLENAVKYVARGAKPQVRLHSQAVDGQVRLWIEDNGIGIPPEIQHKIFDLFERGHPSTQYEGTGIGLAIVRKAVQRMGGQVGVESEPGRGSRFWIQLPKAET